MGGYALFSAGREPLTHTDLSLQTAATVRDLARLGVEAGDAVNLVLPDGPEFLSAYLAVSRAAACAPLNPSLTAAEYEYSFADVQPAAIIVEAGAVSAATAVAEALGIAIFEAHWPHGGPAGCLTLRARTEIRTPRRGRRFAAGLLLHTSAITGNPKLVGLTHEVLAAMGDVTIRALRLTDGDRFLSLMPLFHTQGLLACLAQLRAGGSVIALRGFEPQTFLSAIGEHAPTWYTAGPALHRAMIALAAGVPFPRFRLIRSIGGALPLDLLRRIETTFDSPVIEGYGLTEGGTVTTNPLPPEPRKPGSAGKSAGPEIRLIDGEILLRGPSIITTYANETDNSGAFSGGWLRTGDLGRFDEDGYLYITGRKKEIISRGGEKIRPSDIDEALCAHAGVVEAAPHPSLGEDVAAAVVLRAGATASETELRDFAAGTLAGFKVPRRIHVVSDIPKSATGKPRRAVLASRFAHQSSPEPPANDAEVRIAEIWKALLRIPAAAADDDFFALGGDSLVATLMLTEVQAAFALTESLRDRVEFFDRPTPRALAGIISQMACDANAPVAASRVIALQPVGPLPPLFALPWAGDDPYYFRDVARHLGTAQPFYAIRNIRAVQRVETVEEIARQACETIRGARRSGPFILAGHCFGGIVAFEAAQQFTASGDPPLALLLFDAPTPGYPKLRRAAGRYWRYLLTARSRIRPAALFSHARVIGRLVTRNTIGKVGRTSRSLVPGPTGIDEANFQSARMYKPCPLSVPVFQFIAVDESISTDVLEDPRLGWADFATAGFHVERVPGTHSTMFMEPHAEVLAARIREST